MLKAITQILSKTTCFSRHVKNVKLLSIEGGNCKAEFIVQEEHLNEGGTLHGGYTATLVDCISSYALMSHGHGVPGVSVDIHVSYLAAAKPGETITIDARTIKAGRRMAFLDVELKKKDTEQIIARGQHTKFIGS